MQRQIRGNESRKCGESHLRIIAAYKRRKGIPFWTECGLKKDNKSGFTVIKILNDSIQE